MPNAIPIFQVDAFTDRPFAGNPAAVCLLEAEKDAAWMQSVAREMNLSETAFLAPAEDAIRIRWFTPAVEVALCGHATLAGAHVLWETGTLAQGRPARFLSASGPLGARQDDAWIELDFPARRESACDAPAGLAEGLGLEALYVGRNVDDYLVLAASEAVVRDLAPDQNLLRKLNVRGVSVTARAETPGFDFVSRFFAPGSGIDEDPVTGSAHCCLGPFWAKRLGKSEFTAFQASARGGVVRVRVAGDRVFIGGQAVTVFRGEFAEGV